MERLVQVEHVAKEVDASLVRRRPAEILADVAGERIEDLREEGDAHEDERDRHEAAHLGARERAVDESPEELRVRDLQPDGQQEQE